MMVLETGRLTLHRLAPDDAAFILKLLNDPAFLKFIGDKGVRGLDDARNYILTGPMNSYERFGFGLYLTRLKDSGVPIGICGLLQRESLQDPDVGFAFLPEFSGKGYATESASVVMQHGRTQFGLERIVAVTAPDNLASINVLEKLGMRFVSMIRLTEDGPESKLFAPDD